MAHLIRKIDRYRRWYDTPDWLDKDELLGDILKDITPGDSGKLSVYIIESDQQILSVCAALAVMRPRIDNADYILIDEEALRSEGFKFPPSPNKATAFSSVNSLHHDILELSAREVVRLAHLLKAYGDFDSVEWLKIATFVGQSIASGEINKDDRKIGIKDTQFWEEVEKHL